MTDQMEKQEPQDKLDFQSRLCFKCHPGVECFTTCCADVTIFLSPYDVLRLREALGIGGRDFMSRYADVGVDGDTGLPVVMLRMGDDERRACPFVEPDGCSVYEDRPSPCRTFPIGRGASLAADGSIDEQFVLVREAHCHGFDQGQDWTPVSWMADQGLAEYNELNDAYLAFTARWRATGRVLDRPRFSMVYFGLYHLDEFAERIERKGWLEKLAVDEEQRREILGDGAAQLAFAIEWLGAVLEV